MTRGFLAVSAALLVAAIMLSPAMAYTICSSGKSPYSIGSGSPYQYTAGSGALQPYSVSSGSPYQYTIGSSGLQAYTAGSGSPYQYTMGSGALQPYSIGSGSPYQYTMGSGARQPYSIGMGTPASSIGTCVVTAPAATPAPEVVQPVAEEPVAEEPMDVEPVAEEPMDVEPVAEEPMDVEPVAEEPMDVEPVAEEPMDVEPVAEEPMDVEPVAEEPMDVEPVAEEPALSSILETAIADGNFNILVAAVEAAELTEVLSGEGPFTVFAPTDSAFAAFGEVDLNDVEALTKILAYHVASGSYMAEELADMTTITTLEGSDLTVEVTDEGVRVNGALVVLADIVCSNGVIHVIDAVLIPTQEAEEPEMPPETVVDAVAEIVPPEVEEAVGETPGEVEPPV